jgi:hypothetical protein
MADAQTAFELAISQGRLSSDPTAANYAGDFMFMGRNQSGHATFKHRMTRQYLPALGWDSVLA